MFEQDKKEPVILTGIKIALPGVWMIFCGLLILWIYNLNRNFGSSHWLPLSSKKYIGWALIALGVLFIVFRVSGFIRSLKS